MNSEYSVRSFMKHIYFIRCANFEKCGEVCERSIMVKRATCLDCKRAKEKERLLGLGEKPIIKWLRNSKAP
jgi:ssDNA-binding Zn-finger/Zn-ribbon topoisomerase 1